MTTAELPTRSIPTPFEQLLTKQLYCTAPVYVILAAEFLANRKLDPITAAYLRTGIIQDSRVEDGNCI